MKTLLVAIHGILTNQSDASWPDKLDAWMFERDPSIKVLKKEYAAGPFPRWNCWIKDGRLATSLANEVELFLYRHPLDRTPKPPLWFVAHSNGAVIALRTAQVLARRGYGTTGLILTGAACEADMARNGVLELFGRGALKRFMAYCSQDDGVLAGDPGHEWGKRGAPGAARPSRAGRLRQWLWGRLMAPYGCLGRTGPLLDGRPLMGLCTPPGCGTIGARYFRGGHSTYFAPWNIEKTFTQIHRDVVGTQRGVADEEDGDGDFRPGPWSQN